MISLFGGIKAVTYRAHASIAASGFELLPFLNTGLRALFTVIRGQDSRAPGRSLTIRRRPAFTLYFHILQASSTKRRNACERNH
ncbi:MAG: hypothetical protein D6820_05775 [Lentisphaerae bacterium]|nr:MAG: hypothetical protein D6820_05775 [Lentisphaerota bacterium]